MKSFSTILIILMSYNMSAQPITEKTIWNFESLNQIGNCTTKLFNSPILTAGQKEISFNGIDDGIIVDGNPINGSPSFTVEIVFLPESSDQKNHEQRFFHIQNPEFPDKRILMELRLYENQTWALDGFICSNESKCVLLDAALNHPVDKWYHAALVYDKGTLKSFVNGKLELQGPVDYEPINNGKISLGMRMNQISFFKGKIKQILFSKKAMSSEEFSIPEYVKQN
jgi:hypothetical protein